MDVTFIGANDIQKAACQTTLHNLLNLPFASLPLELTVEFVPDPIPDDPDEFAVTEYDYDSNVAVTKIDSIAPAWDEPYRGIKFLQEVQAHELGHVVFAAIPEAFRVAIARMFGADSDDINELQPKGSAWANRYIEGIAETFKDAFLPRGLRRYANRTNRHIPIHEYGLFRALVRKGVEQIEVDSDIPSYNLDIFRRGGNGEGLHSDQPGTGWESNCSLQLVGSPVHVRGGIGLKFSWNLMRDLEDFLDQVVPNVVPFEPTYLELWSSGGVIEPSFRQATISLDLEVKIGSEVFADWTVSLVSRWRKLKELEELEKSSSAELLVVREVQMLAPINETWYLVWQFEDGGGGPGAPDVTGFPGGPDINVSWEFSTPWKSKELKDLVVKGTLFAFERGLNKSFIPGGVKTHFEPIPELRLKQNTGVPSEAEPIVLPHSEVTPGDRESGRRVKEPTIVGRNR